MRGIAAFIVLLTHIVVVFHPNIVTSTSLLALAIYPLRRIRFRWALLLITFFAEIGTMNYTDRIVLILGGTSLVTFQYAAIFIIGILLATHRESLGRLYRRISVAQRVSLFLASMSIYAGWHLILVRGPFWHFGDMPVAVGAAGLIVVGLNSVAVRYVLNSAVPAFLGRISYSLYLTHEVVLYALLATASSRLSHLSLALIYIPLSIVLSWGFYVAVERPFMLMSRKVGRARPLLSPRAVVLPTESVLSIVPGKSETATERS